MSRRTITERPGTLADPNLELQVIGALLARGERKATADQVFITDAHIGGAAAFDDTGDSLRRATWEALVDVANTGTPPTAATVGGELRKRGLPDTVIREAKEATTLTSVKAYETALDQLVEFRKRRVAWESLIEAGRMIRNGEDAQVVAQVVAANLLDVASGATVDGGSLPDLVDDWRSSRRELVENPESLWYMRWGIDSIDARIGRAIRGGQLVILGAHSKVGKSVACIDLLRANGVRGDLHPLLISVEMRASDCFDRLLSAESGVPYREVRDRIITQFNSEAIEATLDKLRTKRPDDAWITAPLWPSVREVEATIRKHVAMHGTRLVIIDYLQRLKMERGHNREREVSDASRSLKKLADDLNIIIVAAAQLNDDINRRTGNLRRPLGNDVRESKDAHKDSDVFVTIDRPTVRNDNTFWDDAYCTTEVVRDGRTRKYEFARYDFDKFRRDEGFWDTVLWHGALQRFEDVPEGVSVPEPPFPEPKHVQGKEAEVQRHDW